MLLGGCSSGQSTGSDPSNPNQLEAITWWSTGFEKTAYDDLVGEFTRQNPDIEFIDASVHGAAGAEARDAIAVRLASDNAPDTFQAVAGAGLLEYAERGQLQSLTDFYAQHGLTEVFRPETLELLSVDGEIYAVPIDIQRVNVMWSDDALLTHAGIEPGVAPADIDAWLTDLTRLRDSTGVEYPLALGDGLTQLTLFENVLLADLGPARYSQLWKLSSTWTGDRLSRAIDHYEALLDFVDPASGSEGWGETAQRVVNGHAAYAVLAGYASPSFLRAGYTYGTVFSASPAPGTAGTFDFFADAFTLPVGAVHDDAALDWLLTVGSIDGQNALSSQLGAIAARSDADDRDYSIYQRDAVASLRADSIVPSLTYGVAAAPSWVDDIEAALVQFRSDRHPKALASLLTAAADAALRTD